jgi:glutaredoxin
LEAAATPQTPDQMAKVTLYSKQECPLCDEARAALGRVRASRPFQLEEVDIEQDPKLQSRYGERVPVVALDGEELFDFVVDEQSLEQRLAAGGPARVSLS